MAPTRKRVMNKRILWIALAVVAALAITAIIISLNSVRTIQDIDAGNERVDEYETCVEWMTEDMEEEGFSGDDIDRMIEDSCLDTEVFTE